MIRTFWYASTLGASSEYISQQRLDFALKALPLPSVVERLQSVGIMGIIRRPIVDFLLSETQTMRASKVQKLAVLSRVDISTDSKVFNSHTGVSELDSFLC
mmetsp:Transcript_36505/g.91347  ORF Transcript_36505/g.91347 Transcript_36505/m.91347 type:complete len:101 (-) Transcript_36505:852-1154(-)